MMETLPAPQKELLNMRGRRGRAARVLGSLGQEAKSAVPALKQLLSGGKLLGDRLEAAEALWRIEADAATVLPVLRSVLTGELKMIDVGPNGEDWTKPLQVRAAEILGLMGPAARPAAAALATAIEQEAAAENPSFWLRAGKADEEDDDPNTADLMRRVGLAALRKIDPKLATQTEEKLTRK